MPETPQKARLHPYRLPADPGAAAVIPQSAFRIPHSYVELSVTSNFTFLTGASHPEQYIESAAALGYPAVALTDTNTLAGTVRAHVAAKEAGIRLVVGCRLALTETLGSSILVYPTSAAAYGRLCQMLTLGKRRAAKGECHLALHDLLDHQEGLVAIVVPPAALSGDVLAILRRLREVFDEDRLSLAASFAYRQDDHQRVARIAAAARHVSVPMVATNDVLYHVPQRKALADVVSCIRMGCTLEEAGLKLGLNAERYLKPPAEMTHLFAEYPHPADRALQPRPAQVPVP
jgi:error-prone DNA polymerase